MLRFLLTSLISLSLGLSGMGLGASHAYAQAGTTPQPATPTNAQAAQPTVGSSIMQSANDSVNRRAGNDTSGEEKPMSYVQETIYGWFVSAMTAIMTLFAWLLGIAMIMLDNAILYTVVYMGSYIKGLSAIGVTWDILRNVGNILLIFGFLAIGIGMILNVGWYGGRDMIPRLIMGAVFLNFSLFMTEAIIDVGNFLATRIYTQINGGAVIGAAPSLAPGGNILAQTQNTIAGTASVINNEAVSSKIMNQLGLQRLYGDALNGNKELLKANNIPLVAMLGVLLFIVLAFVMFFLSFILISRFVYLIYAIIVAPIGLVGFVIPQFNSFGKDWLYGVFRQSMIAPVMLLLLYVALRIITDAHFLGFGAPPDFTGFIADRNGGYNIAGFANILISFFVAIGALLGVVYGTRKLGAFGSDWAAKTAGKWSFGLAALSTRLPLGFLSQAGSKLVRQSRFRSTNIGRFAATTLDKGATGSWDIRGSKAGSATLKTLGIDAGTAQEKGYRGQMDKNIKKYEAYGNSLVGREKTKEDNMNLADAAKAAVAAKAAFEKATEDHTKASNAHKDRVDEVKRLEEEEKKHVETNNLVQSTASSERLQETRQKLDTAREAMSASGANVKSLKLSLDAAEKEHEAKKKIEVGVKKDIESRAGVQDAKNARVEYGENLKKGWFGIRSALLFGSGVSEAAKKLVKLQSKEQEAVENLKKALKEGAEAEKPTEQKGGKPEEKSKEKPKEAEGSK